LTGSAMVTVPITQYNIRAESGVGAIEKKKKERE
jgi:hypothetical protein